MINCELKLDYDDEKTASVIGKSIEPDNKSYVDMEIEGSTIICKIKSEEPLQLLQTADDLLSCVTVAEETHNVD
ncbi:MAG: KEOPS complex subunit Pcc1 [Candidatus Thermoplasmatota archaeon]